jgi:acetyl/propionyl-CoA carboxylase alpha subunit
VWGETRAAAVRRIKGALREFRISGVKTDLPFLAQIIQSDCFLDADFDTTYLDQAQPALIEAARGSHNRTAALALAMLIHQQQTIPQAQPAPAVFQQAVNPWRMAALQEQVL